MKKLKKTMAIITSHLMIAAIAFFPSISVMAKEGLEISSKNFPDAVFCDYVKASFDTDKDGYLSDEEILSITEVDITDNLNLQSLNGIEYFSELTKVWVYGSTNLSYMDLSKNTKLRDVQFDGTKVTLVDLSKASAFDDILDVQPETLNYTGADGVRYEYKAFVLGNIILCICDNNLVITKNKSYDYNNGVIENTNTVDWLDPLRTQLHIAADPEFGANVNNTADYTGDFALPAEIMQYIKDNPQVTLNYSFYVDDVLRTVTITGKNVVVEEGVLYYGFNYLLSHYGDGSAVTGPTGIYTIVKGDTLTSIAKKFGTTIEALAAKNGIKNVDLIYAGAKIAY